MTGTPDPAAHETITAAFSARVARAPNARALAYFDGALGAAEVEETTDALAAGLSAMGVGHGDRVGVYLQNVPQYALSLLALWKLGAIALVLNPMYRDHELRRLVDDARPVGVICADTATTATRATLADSDVRWLLSTNDHDFQNRDDPRVFSDDARPAPSIDGDLVQVIDAHRGQAPPRPALGSDDIALLTYTSGTTGPPKGAKNTHGNILAVVATFGSHVGLTPGDVVLAVAPLFHITGAVINAVMALLQDSTLVFTNRFHPEVALDAFTEHGVTFTIGSITVFNALYECPQATREHFRSVKTLYSGGAPIPPSTVERFERRFGVYIHNAYGMTETTSGVVAVPPGQRAPVDEASGSLSIGHALPGLRARVVDPEGNPVAPDQQGELELAGPQVIRGYWENPEATAHTLPGGRLRTGDGARIDEDGWIYLVDRLKDQINVSGFKVWPREVEDVLYQHPAVYEAAVVGQPDDYRGESVVAYVSLTPDAQATEQELLDHANSQLAAYKRPRSIHVITDLPKTLTGKIRRRVLREGE